MIVMPTRRIWEPYAQPSRLTSAVSPEEKAHAPEPDREPETVTSRTLQFMPELAELPCVSSGCVFLGSP